jgi:uncharacterized protein YbjQ (UPF0145 family)
MPTKCSLCNVELALQDWSGRSDSPHLEVAHQVGGAYLCYACASKQGGIASDANLSAMNAEQEMIQSVIVTTTPSLDGYRVTKVVDVISAECVFGMNIFKDFFAGLTDFFGGRSETSQKVLKDARQLCIKELKTEAHRVGANAVIGVNLDYSEFSGQGKSMLFLVASGTAVVLEEVKAPIETTGKPA